MIARTGMSNILKEGFIEQEDDCRVEHGLHNLGLEALEEAADAFISVAPANGSGGYVLGPRCRKCAGTTI